MSMMTEMRDRIKSRIGIYSTGWNPSSVMGLLLPFLLVAILALIGWFFVIMLQSL
jgi:hypothetical protein